MEKPKLLFVTQEMKPYLQLTEIANLARELPQYMQEQGMEVRVLMPKFGTINERRHKLHEVVRLSGINIIIGEDDYPLLIKVASLPGARLQVYFLDNDDFFARKSVFSDKSDNFFEDNPERMIFFCKGVVETVKKFGWAPDIVHCNGWMTSLVPLYMKTAFKNEPIFTNSKIIYTINKETAEGNIASDFLKKAPLLKKNVNDKSMALFKEGSVTGLNKGAIACADGLIFASDEVNDEVMKAAEAIKGPKLKLATTENEKESIKQLYDDLLQQKAKK